MSWREGGPWPGLVDIARFAPSPHNGQVWRVALDPHDPLKATLLFEPQNGLPNTDPGNRFTYAGMGAFLEVARRAAASSAYGFRYRLLPGEIDAGRPAGDLQPVASMQLVRVPVIAVADEVGLLRDRQTSRKRFDKGAVPSAVVADCTTAASAFGHVLTGSDDKDFVKWLVGLNRDTLFYDLSETVAREELQNFMRFSEKRAREAGDGFSPSSLGMPGPLVKFFFKHHKIANAPLLGNAFKAIYGYSGGGVASAFWLRGPFETHDDHINAGRALVSVWLELTKNGVSMQPYGSVVTNHHTNKELQERLGTKDADGNTLWLVGRMGYGPKPPQSYRLPLDRVLV